MNRISKSHALVGSLGLVALAACSGSSDSSRPGIQPLTVSDVDVADRADVRRNQEVTLEFASEVDPLTVTSETIRITPEPLFDSPVPGRFLVNGHRVTFQPALALDDDGEDSEIGPVGFRENTRYRIDVPGTLRLTSVTSRLGFGIMDDYVAYFRTTNRFLPDGTRPQAILPRDGQLLSVQAISQVRITFTEPMDPRSFLAEDAFVVRVAGGQEVRGTLRFNRSLTTVTFRPEWNETAGGVYYVTLSDRITDLAGNPIETPRDQRSMTVAVSVTGIEDDDLVVVPLRLPSGEAPRVPPTQQEGERPFFGRDPAHAMALYTPDDIGSAGFLHGLYLGLGKERVEGAIYGSLEVSLWTTSASQLDPDFEKNLSVEGRTVVKRDDFFVVAARDSTYLPIRFDQPFPYNGKDNVIVEIHHTGGGGANPARLLRGTYGHRIVAPLSEAKGTLDEAFDVVFQRTTKGMDVKTGWKSLSSTALDPKLDPILAGSRSYVDDHVLVEFQGARGIDDDRSYGASDFVRDLSQLEGYRFVRARLTRLADLPGEADLEIYSLALPIR